MKCSPEQHQRSLWVVIATFFVGLLACACGLGGRQPPSTNLPVWSPDGERIAYIACKKECTIYLINVDGGGLTQLTSEKADLQPPAWSPDGQQIAFVRTLPALSVSYWGPDTDVNIINTDGTGLVTIGGGERPVWSPDGSQVAYACGCPNCLDEGLHVVNADGSNLETVMGAGHRTIAWSPDGLQIYFQSFSFDSSLYETYVINADGSNEAFITDALTNEVLASLSPDGGYFLFADGGDIYILNVDGSGLTHLSGDLAEGERPLWSPNGEQIVLVSDRDGNNEIYVMNADGSSLVRLTDDPASDEDPAWSPDGTRIVFVSYRDRKQGDLYVMHADGSNLTRLTDR